MSAEHALQYAQCSARHLHHSSLSLVVILYSSCAASQKVDEEDPFPRDSRVIARGQGLKHTRRAWHDGVVVACRTVRRGRRLHHLDLDLNPILLLAALNLHCRISFQQLVLFLL